MKKTINVYIETPIGTTTDEVEIEFDSAEDFEAKAEAAAEESYTQFIEAMTYGYE